MMDKKIPHYIPDEINGRRYLSLPSNLAFCLAADSPSTKDFFLSFLWPLLYVSHSRSLMLSSKTGSLCFEHQKAKDVDISVNCRGRPLLGSPR